MRPSSPKGSGYIVNALFAGRDDKKDVLAGILIRYEAGPTVDQLSADIGEDGRLRPGSPLGDADRASLANHLFLAKWSWAFVKRLDFEPSAVAFDAAFEKKS